MSYIFTRGIKKCTAYRVGAVLYRTPRAAAKAQAWSMISSKYADFGKLEDIRKIRGMACECADSDELGEYFRWECCKIHDREIGYLARLHARLFRAILKFYANQLAENP